MQSRTMPVKFWWSPMFRPSARRVGTKGKRPTTTGHPSLSAATSAACFGKPASRGANVASPCCADTRITRESQAMTPNLIVHTGAADYGHPDVEGMITINDGKLSIKATSDGSGFARPYGSRRFAKFVGYLWTKLTTCTDSTRTASRSAARSPRPFHPNTRTRSRCGCCADHWKGSAWAVLSRSVGCRRFRRE